MNQLYDGINESLFIPYEQSHLKNKRRIRPIHRKTPPFRLIGRLILRVGCKLEPGINYARDIQSLITAEDRAAAAHFKA